MGALGPTEGEIGRGAKREREKSKGFTVDRESNGVKGEFSWSCVLHMTRTHVNF